MAGVKNEDGEFGGSFDMKLLREALARLCDFAGELAGLGEPLSSP